MFKFLFISALLFFLGYGIVSFLTRNFKGMNSKQNRAQTQNQAQQTEPKRFSEDVGEYVTYEEIKEDKKEQ